MLQEYVSKNDYIQYRVNINQLTKEEKQKLFYLINKSIYSNNEGKYLKKIFRSMYRS
jgi:hypothetical protein